MPITIKSKPSDYLVIVLGLLGLLLGLMGLFNPASQYKMIGIGAISPQPDGIISGLFASGSLSAIYVGVLYIYGVVKRWPGFKVYLIFARMVMCIGFLLLVTMGRAPHAFVPAAIWEGIGALLILLALWMDSIRKPSIQA